MCLLVAPAVWPIDGAAMPGATLPGDGRRAEDRPLPRLREPGHRCSGQPGCQVRLEAAGRRPRREGPGGGAAGVRRLVAVRRRSPDAHPGARRVDRDAPADGHQPEERRRHQARRRCHRVELRARLPDHLRHRHRRLRLHAPRPQAAGDEQAGDRCRGEGFDLGAAPPGVRRVHLLRHAGRRRGIRAGGAPAAPPARRGGPARGGAFRRARRRRRGSRPAGCGRPGDRDRPDRRRAGQRHRGSRAGLEREADAAAQGPRRSTRPTTGSAPSAS